jgi:hypothetical protein
MHPETRSIILSYNDHPNGPPNEWTQLEYDHPGYEKWEEKDVNGKFIFGANVTISIEKDGRNRPKNTVAGTATWNKDHGYACLRDDDRVVWQTDHVKCESTYFCQVCRHCTALVRYPY